MARLFDTEPPPYNRPLLESRLAYRIQELAYGGLKRETVDGFGCLANSTTASPAAGRPAQPAPADRRKPG